MDLNESLGLGVAMLGGAAVGLERQWSGHASGPKARFAGIRTFTLLGGLGGLCGWLWIGGFEGLALVLLSGGAALVVAAYVAASRHDVDGTTEVAALVALAAGALAGAGSLALASAIFAGTAALLLEKGRLHAIVSRIDDAPLRASLRFAVLACVVLPLIPPGPFGPLDAIRPRELWALVLFCSGLTFAGWLARRVVGARQGVIVSGLLGGLVSSTSVMLTFARASRDTTSPRSALAAGAVAACTVMLLRVTVVCAVLNPALAIEQLRYATPAFVPGLVFVLAGWRARRPAAPDAWGAGSPLQLRAALQMAAVFQAVLFVIAFVQAGLGPDALVATSAFIGLTDLDALTLSLARGTAAPNSVPLVAVALAAGIQANTMLKFAVAVVVGRGSFRLIAGMGLALMALAMGVALAVR